MSHLPNQPLAGSIKHIDVQDLLETAQLAAGRLYGDVPYLCEALQAALRDGVQKCDMAEVDAMKILEQQVRTEWRILDAYNKHRLGRAAHIYYKKTSVPENPVDYDEADNVPNAFKFFPLTYEIRLHGFQVTQPEIYQVPGTIEHNQEFSARVIRIAAAAPTRVTPSPTPLSNNGQSSGKKKSGRGQASYDKLSDAPIPWLSLPDGNLTLAEILCFVPHSIKSWDVIDRILHNGAFTGTIAGMINHFRNMPQGQIENNSVYRAMQGPILRRAKTEPEYESWSVSKHHTLKKPHGFDPASVSVQGFRAPVNYYRRDSAVAAAESIAGTILFRDLMNGVKIMPTGYDALDLTRCVQYCVDNPDEDWYYPQDFARLVSRLPYDPRRQNGPRGPSPVLPGHQDRAAVDRHTSVHKQRGAKRNVTRWRNNPGRLAAGFESEEEKDMETGPDESAAPSRKRKYHARSPLDSDSEDGESPSMIRNAKRKKVPLETPTRTRNSNRLKASPSPLHNKIAMDDIDSGSDENNYQAPRRKVKRTRTLLRFSGRTKHTIGFYNVDAALGGEDEFETPTKKGVIPLTALRLMGGRTEAAEDEEMDDVSDLEY